MRTDEKGDQAPALMAFLTLLDTDMAVRPTEAMRPLAPVLAGRIEALAMEAAGVVDPHASIKGEVSL